MPQELAPGPSLGETFGVSLVVLAIVCLVAYLFFRLFFARPGRPGRGRIRVLDRCPLEPRRALYLVEVHDKTLLIGSGEGGIRTLAEVAPGPADATPGEDEPRTGPVRFIDVLRKLGGRK
jgi:flagellar biosynthetic protein FliO